jgi:hypothetical protein
MLMRWYDSVYSPDGQTAHFLLPDLSVTHAQTVSVIDATGGRPLPPQHHLDQIIDTIAMWHGYWWEHPSLERDIGPIHGGYRTLDEFERTVMTERVSNLSDFIAQESSSLSPALRHMFERTLSNLPALYQRRIAPRLRDRRNVTLNHGDCYFGQFMCPKDSTTGAQTILMDLESANTFLAGLDLAFLFATFWPRTIRQQDDRERNCLRRYHQRLLAQRPMIDFSFDNLLHDYRLAIAMMIFYPIWDKVVGGSDRTYWWPKLNCLCDAFEDLHCDELFTKPSEQP